MRSLTRELGLVVAQEGLLELEPQDRGLSGEVPVEERVLCGVNGLALDGAVAAELGVDTGTSSRQPPSRS